MHKHKKDFNHGAVHTTANTLNYLRTMLVGVGSELWMAINQGCNLV